MARPRFRHVTPAEKRRAIAKYRRALAKGKSPTAAARQAGTDLTTMERWIDAESAPVAIAKDRRCLGGCGRTFRSEHPGNRVCPSCNDKFAALPAAYK